MEESTGNCVLFVQLEQTFRPRVKNCLTVAKWGSGSGHPSKISAGTCTMNGITTSGLNSCKPRGGCLLFHTPRYCLVHFGCAVDKTAGGLVIVQGCFMDHGLGVFLWCLTRRAEIEHRQTTF